MPKKTVAISPDGRPPVVLPESGMPVGFRSEYLDFDRGIHVGNLEEHERITRILKLALEARYGQPFVTERWGRGVYWQWIGYLPRANRAAKPISSNVSFGCSKFFLTVDTGERLFKCGMQVERGYVKAPREFRQGQFGSDWDWHRLVEALNPGGALERELERLVLGEGFTLRAGGWEDAAADFSGDGYPGVRKFARRWNPPPRTTGPGSSFTMRCPRAKCAARRAWTWWNRCWPYSAK